jgi:hypothetical protein
MFPTPWGALVIIVGVWLYFKPAAYSAAFAFYCSLFAGASAIDLPLLGSSSIPPSVLSLAFLALRITRRDTAIPRVIILALEKNAWLIVFCIYAALTALILPKIFEGRVKLIPMGAAGKGFVPLHVTSQNITTAVYLLGTGFAAWAGTIVSVQPGSTRIVARAFLVITWIHIVTGMADLAFSFAHIGGAFDIFRNGAYAQLDQGYNGVHRISGLCPEPSVYAGLGTMYFIFMSELWLRNIDRLASGFTALAVMLMVILTTSTTGYITLVAYAAVLLARAFLVPASISATKTVILVSITAVGVALSLAFAVFVPAAAGRFIGAVTEMTLNKAHTASGVERSLWAKQGLIALQASHGLGVGVGSFRSSGLFSAILGSIGPAGAIVFAAYCLQVAKFGKRSTYVPSSDFDQSVAAAAGWTVDPSRLGLGVGRPGHAIRTARRSLAWMAQSPQDPDGYTCADSASGR